MVQALKLKWRSSESIDESLPDKEMLDQDLTTLIARRHELLEETVEYQRQRMTAQCIMK